MSPISFYTYVSAYGKRSCLDWCLASPNFAPITHMKQLPDIGSDHIPINIIVECEPCNIKISYHRRWKADDKALTEFSNKLGGSENVNIRPDSINNITREFTTRIFESAEDTIKRTSGRVKSRRQICWWNEQCSLAVAKRRQARKQLERYPCRVNIIRYTEKTAKAKKCVKKVNGNLFICLWKI